MLLEVMCRKLQGMASSMLAVSLVVLFFALQVCGKSSPDRSTLQSFMASTNANPKFLNWTGDPCINRWYGVQCNSKGRVTELVLEGLQLMGPIYVLSNLTQLRLLSLKSNHLNGTLPDMTYWINMRHLYLQGNQFSGPLPENIGALSKLVRLSISSNQLSGSIPRSFAQLVHLATLRLENNQLSGSIPALQLPNLIDFNVSYNQLGGPIPASLDKYGMSAFLGNPLLCSQVAGTACNVSSLGPVSSPPMTVPSTSATGPGSPSRRKKSGLSKGAIVAIVLGDAAALLLITLAFLFYYWYIYPSRTDEKPTKKTEEKDTSSQYAGVQLPESERTKLVFFQTDNKHIFELEDLLRASAEMLGKGSFGTAYKAVLEDGAVVAVKRLKDVSTSSKKEFEQQMEFIGKLHHPNVLSLRAYYYAKEEKLLVYDFQPNGSLYSLLHGNRGPGRTPLDWVTRLKIAVGVARGLTYLHQECGAQKIPHGNIKSSNILLDKSLNPLIADFGLALLMNSTAAPSRVAGYRAPEHADTKRISQRADVYSFGVMLLELLTGKAPATLHPQDEGIDLPRWVNSVVREEWTAEVFDIELMRYKNIEEDMVSMLQAAMLCIEPVPERRPKMNEVVSLLEKLCVEESPLHDDSRSLSQSPSASDDATASG